MPHNFDVDPPPPPDLTKHLVKIHDQYYTGGGFGDVHKCWCRNGEKEVAVKALRFKLTMATGGPNSKSIKMLHRELEIWRRLEHVNVVPFLGIAYGFGMHGSIALVSLWMSNESLPIFLEKHDNILGLEHRLQLLLDIANGLYYLHSFPIVHGDLSSNNVLIDENYNARLVDFGHASLVKDIPEGLSYLQRSTKQAGSLRWAAPEQINPEGECTWETNSDIYSFGCVGLQVLSGKPPWSEVQGDVAIILRLSNGQKPGRPESLPIEDLHWDFIQRCWLLPRERPDAKEIVVIIQQFLESFEYLQPPFHLLTPKSSRVDSLVVESPLSQHCAVMEDPYNHGNTGVLEQNNQERPVGCSPQNLYAKMLKPQAEQFGYPLWSPGPKPNLPLCYQENGLYIGDIGYIDASGAFEVLFNICFPPDHILHLRSHTDLSGLVGLAQFDLNENLPMHRLPPGHVISHGTGEPRGDALEQPQSFVSCSTSGAILILPHGAVHQRLNKSKEEEFRKLAEKHALGWCKLDSRQPRADLYLITGFYKTKSWHLASFHDVTPIGKVILKCDDAGYFSCDPRLDYHCSKESRTENQAVLISGFKIQPGKRGNPSVKKLS